MNSKLSHLDRPWLNAKGEVLSDSQINSISGTWDDGSWNQFLTETVEINSARPQEEQISPRRYLIEAELMDESIWQCGDLPENDNLSELIRRLCRDHLSVHQQHTIRLLFWDGLSERAVAEIKGISRSTVAVQKRRALNKLKYLIEARTPVLRSSEGAKRKISSRQKGDRYADLQEVYQQEIRTWYGKFQG
ncbi:MAG: sigma factor-like helix-turn-helix DNA-binding protein [Bdellovibrionota bacterium]